MDLLGYNQNDQVACTIAQAIRPVHYGQKSEQRLLPQPREAFSNSLIYWQLGTGTLPTRLEIATNKAQRKHRYAKGNGVYQERNGFANAIECAANQGSHNADNGICRLRLSQGL